MKISLRTECLNTNQIYLSNYLQMEKLIELLNEYGNERYNHWGDYQTDMDFTDKEIYWYLSKKFWFIEWLVREDKIDFSLIPNKIKEIWIPMKINWKIKYWFDSSDYYWLLMLLSISSSPLEDLLLYLK